jgi:hypothetical protein
LCGLVVVFAANTANYKQAYDSQKALATAAKNEAINAMDALKSGLARRDATHIVLNNNMRALEAQNARLLADRFKEVQARKSAEEQALVATSTKQSLVDQVAAMYSTENHIQEALDSAHEKMLHAQAQLVEIRRELNGEQNRADQLESISKQYREKIYALEDSIVNLRNQLQQVTLASRDPEILGDQVSQTPDVALGIPIRGQITEVDDNLASISVGSASGVQKDMRFKVYRDNSYLGDLKIVYVQPGEAAGRLESQQSRIVKGDSVTTGFN